MQYQELLRNKITAAFAPIHLEITDNSNLHKGHSGAHPSGETHFHVLVVAEAFRGKSRLERQRMVYKAVDEALRARVHALEIKTLAPDEHP